ncbi:MAG: translocation/assembly module TamB domain-containing protein [Desulfobacterales bacterium]|nr:translocation/assembly module TamB domain-containing protein [Desulfobacterales bacterium]
MTIKVKKVFAGIGIFLSLLFFILVTILFYIETDYAQRFIQTKVNQLIPGEILWDKFQFSLIRGKFEMKNMSLNSPDKKKLAGFDRLSIDLAWMSLFKKNLTIEEFILDKPWAMLQVDKDGELNIKQAFPPSKPDESKPIENEKSNGFPINIIVKSFNLLQGQVHYGMEKEKLEAEIQQIYLTADANLFEQSSNLRLEIGKGSFKNPKIQTELSPLNFQANFKKGRIDPLILQASTLDSKIALTGGIDDIFSKPIVDLSLNVGVSLPEVRKIFQIESNLTGKVNTHLIAKGDLNNPETTLQFEYGGGVLSKINSDRIDLNFHLKDRFLTIKSSPQNGVAFFDLNGEIDLQDAFSNGFLSPQRDLDAISYKIDFNQKGIQLEQLLLDLKPIQGTLSSNISITGKGISPHLLTANTKINLLVKQLMAGPQVSPIDLHLKADAGLDKGLVKLKQLSGEAGEIKVAAAGDFDFESEQFKTTISMEAPNMSDNLASMGLSGVRGAVLLQTHASGSVKQPIFDFNLIGKQLGFQEITMGNINLQAGLDQSGKLEVSEFELENQGSNLKATGSMQIFKNAFTLDDRLPLEFSAVFDNIETPDFLNKKLAAGTIKGKLNLSGSAKAPQATLSLQGKNLAVAPIHIGDIDANLQFSKGNFYFDSVKIQNKNSKILVSGNAQVLEPETLKPLEQPIVNLDLTADPMDIEDFTSQLKGKINLVAHVEGNPKQPKGTIKLDGKNIDLGIQKIAKIELSSEMDGGKIWVQPLKIAVVPAEWIEATGWLSLDENNKSYQIKLTSDGVSLSNIEKVREQQIADGKMMLDLSGTGTFKDPVLQGDLSLTQLRINKRDFDDFKIYLDIRDQLAQISGKLNFDINGSFHLQRKDFAANILFDETDLSPYTKIADKPDLNGKLSGKIEIAGKLEALDQIQVISDLPKVDLFYKDIEILRTRNFKIAYKNQEITIPPLRIHLLKEGQLDINGQGRLDGPLMFQMTGDIPLHVIGLMVEDLSDITGNINIDAGIKGTRLHPDIRADIQLAHIGLTVPTLMQKLHDLNGRIQITPEAVTIERIGGQLDTGRFDLNGKIDLKAYQPAKVMLFVNANALPLQVPDTLDMLLNTELKIQGTPEKSNIQGQLVILEGLYYKDVNLSLLQGLKQKKREEAPLASEISLPFLKNMSLDISVKHRNPFLIQNNLSELELKPDLRITGNLNHPIVGGRAAIVENGTINYQKKNFVVTKGVIDFLNPYKIEPTIDVKGEVNVRKWLIYLQITGTSEKLNFKLTSNPEETDGDIISLLVLGRTTGELIAGEGGTTQSTEQFLAEMIATTFGEDIKQATGLDILEVGNGGEDEEGASDRIKVTVGKALSKRMTVKYGIESKDGEMVQRAIAEYKFLENILLSGFQDSRGIFGGALQFRLEFR